VKTIQENDIFVHESSYIDDNTEIGEGTKIWHFCHIQSGSKIGKNCVLGQNVNISPGSIVGDGVKIQNNVSVYKGVIVEDDVFLGPSMVFTNVNNPRAFIERKDEFKTTTIKVGATIGANATVVCGATIGRYAFVGAGAVVTKDVRDYEMVYGVPAKHKRWICKCGEKLVYSSSDKGIRMICHKCQKRYDAVLENGYVCTVSPLIIE